MLTMCSEIRVLYGYGKPLFIPYLASPHVDYPSQQALGRTFFAFSRDGLIPGSHIWIKINSFTQTPLYAVWLSVILIILINLIALGSYIAITGVFNVTAIALDWSYVIPIICKLASNKFEPGPWYLGKASKFVNSWAVIWTSFTTIIFILPTVRPVKANNVSTKRLC